MITLLLLLATILKRKKYFGSFFRSGVHLDIFCNILWPAIMSPVFEGTRRVEMMSSGLWFVLLVSPDVYATVMSSGLCGAWGTTDKFHVTPPPLKFWERKCVVYFALCSKHSIFHKTSEVPSKRQTVDRLEKCKACKLFEGLFVVGFSPPFKNMPWRNTTVLGIIWQFIASIIQ